MTRTDRQAIRTPRAVALAAALCSLALVACIGSPPKQGASPGGVTAEDVVNASPLAAGGSPGVTPEADILAVSPEMRAFIDAEVDRDAYDSRRLSQLLSAVIGDEDVALDYDYITDTAAGTFSRGHGNCLAFTNMFVAMVRDIGLEARFQEVEVEPDWSIQGETFLFTTHVNVMVDVRRALGRVVDFNSYSAVVDVERESVPISDARARAHFYSNVGVERMLAGDVQVAYANLRQSIREDETFASPWVNLGVLHRREGLPEYAEAAYLKALDHDSDNLVAMSNLAVLYRESNRTEAAKYYLSRVETFRRGNPYYRYRVAQSAYDKGDYDEAVRSVRYAIRQKDDDDRFYHLLSLSYLKTGDWDKAEKSMKTAAEVARTNQQRGAYSRKLEMISRRDPL